MAQEAAPLVGRVARNPWAGVSNDWEEVPLISETIKDRKYNKQLLMENHGFCTFGKDSWRGVGLSLIISIDHARRSFYCLAKRVPKSNTPIPAFSLMQRNRHCFFRIPPRCQRVGGSSKESNAKGNQMTSISFIWRSPIFLFLLAISIIVHLSLDMLMKFSAPLNFEVFLTRLALAILLTLLLD